MERPAGFAALLLALAAVFGACSKQDDPQLSGSCREGPRAVLAALAAAPGEVRLADGQSLSDCLEEARDAGDVQEIGAFYLEAARRLAPRAAREPGGDAAVQLGYLLGAARRGTTRNIGVHEEMVRRMEIEADDVDVSNAAFRRGERAGMAGG